MEYITASCVITNQAVYRNGEKLFPAGPPSSGAPPAAAPALPTGPGDLLTQLYQYFNWQYAKYFRMDSLSRLGFAAAEILLKDWNSEAYREEDIAIVLSNANSSLDTDYKYTETTKDIPSPGVFVYTLPNIVIGEISIRHRFKGENAFFLSESFDAGLLTKYVSCLLEAKIARACLTGWVELLGDQYKAALFLIEEKPSPGSLTFTPENLSRIFKNLTT